MKKFFKNVWETVCFVVLMLAFKLAGGSKEPKQSEEWDEYYPGTFDN